MAGHLLDTHYWLWLQTGQEGKLSHKAVAAIEGWQRAGDLYLSAISTWEIALLVAHRRIILPSAVMDWVDAALRDGGAQMLPLTPEILVASTQLPGTLHSDPADRMLIATARIHNLTLITADRLILDYAAKHQHVKARRL